MSCQLVHMNMPASDVTSRVMTSLATQMFIIVLYSNNNLYLNVSLIRSAQVEATRIVTRRAATRCGYVVNTSSSFENYLRFSDVHLSRTHHWHSQWDKFHVACHTHTWESHLEQSLHSYPSSPIHASPVHTHHLCLICDSSKSFCGIVWDNVVERILLWKY